MDDDIDDRVEFLASLTSAERKELGIKGLASPARLVANQLVAAGHRKGLWSKTAQAK